MFSELTFLAEWWSGLDIKLYGTKEDFEKLGKESAICLCNHRSDVDWLIGYTVAGRAGVLAVCELNWRPVLSSDQLNIKIVVFAFWYMDNVHQDHQQAVQTYSGPGKKTVLYEN